MKKLIIQNQNKFINEHLWSGIIHRSETGEVRREDKELFDKVKEFLNNRNHKDVDFVIHSDGTVDFKAVVTICNDDLIDGKFPFKFGRVMGNFYAYGLKIKTLENSPREVDGNFVIYDNKDLHTLVGGPEIVHGNFAANGSGLHNLDGSPKVVDGNFEAAYTNLRDISGISPNIGGNVKLTNNSAKFTEDDVRKYSNVKGNITV